MASLPIAADSRDITRTLVLPVRVDDAWNLWTHSDELEQWLTTKANVNPHLGGAYELFWNPETPNQNSTKGCKVTSLIQQQLISFEWKGPVPYADLMNTDPPPTWVLVTFEPLSETMTLMHFRHSGWGDGTRWKEARTWQEQAWDMAFQMLREQFKN